MSVDLRSANGIARKVQPWLGLREWEVGLSNHTAKSKEGAKQMSQQRVPSKTDTTYRYLHLSAEDLAQLPPDELLQACREARRLLDIIKGVLDTPDSPLSLRAVTIDLLFSEAERLSRKPGVGADAPVTQDIKTVSDRLRIDNDVDGPIEVRDPLYRTG